MSESTESGLTFVCVPCEAVIPDRNGTITVHGETNPDNLKVWCPWCGDEMEYEETLSGGTLEV